MGARFWDTMLASMKKILRYTKIQNLFLYQWFREYTSRGVLVNAGGVRGINHETISALWGDSRCLPLR